jgi:NitT/TauT family transport system substrate-binding protein
VLALALVGAGCGSDEEEPAGGGAAAEEKTELVKIAGPLVISPSAAYNIAQAKGYFAEKNLKVEGAELKAGQDAIALLSAGQIDVVIGGTSAGMFNALSRGLEFKVVGTMGTTTGEPPPGGCQLEVSKKLMDSGKVKSVSDLKGRKFAISGGQGSTGAYLLATMLETGGLTLKDVELVNVDHPDMEAAIKSGAVAGGLPATPFNVNMEKAGITKSIATCPANLSGVSILFGAKFMEKPAAQRFFDALVKASVEDLQGEKRNSTENKKILADASGQKLEVLEAMPLENWDPKLAPPVKTFEESQKVFLETGTLDYEEPIPTSEFIDSKFSDNAGQ